MHSHSGALQPFCLYLFRLGDLLVRLVPQLREDPLPVGEALAARQAHGHLAVRDLPVVDRVLGRQERVLDEAARALVALLAADACFGDVLVTFYNVLVTFNNALMTFRDVK